MTDLLKYLMGRALADAGDIKLDLSKTGLANPSDFATIWNTIYRILFAFLAAAAFIGIIYSGIMMITASGDATKFAAGKKNLIWAIIGIIVLVLAYFIIQFVYKLTGEIVKPPAS